MDVHTQYDHRENRAYSTGARSTQSIPFPVTRRAASKPPVLNATGIVAQFRGPNKLARLRTSLPTESFRQHIGSDRLFVARASRPCISSIGRGPIPPRAPEKVRRRDALATQGQDGLATEGTRQRHRLAGWVLNPRVPAPATSSARGLRTHPTTPKPDFPPSRWDFACMDGGGSGKIEGRLAEFCTSIYAGPVCCWTWASGRGQGRCTPYMPVIPSTVGRLGRAEIAARPSPSSSCWS